jgi:hypothetical protein
LTQRLSAARKSAQKTRAERLEAGFADPNSAEASKPGIDEHHLLDPEVQNDILNPKPLGPFSLVFDDARPARQISIPTAFTPNMVNHRRILDELESMSSFVMVQLGSKIPPGQALTTDWLSERANQALVGWAVLTPDVREMTRSIISKLTGEPPNDIADGLGASTLAQITVALMIVFSKLRKNSQRAMVAPE